MIGDEVLKLFVDRSSAALRQSSDWIARFGGEEFAIVLPETGIEGAAAAAEKLRAHCGDTPFQTSTGELRVTVSVGVAAMPLLPSRPTSLSRVMDELLSRADSALYKSKQDGRNRISVAQ